MRLLSPRPRRLSSWPALVLLCASSWCTVAPASELARNAPLPSPPPEIPMSAVSIWVASVDGIPRAALNAGTHRQMASLMKLFTTGASLLQWGPDHRWHTEVGLGGTLDASGHLHGPLHWRASGDPSLDGTRLQAMLSHWRRSGLQHIHGDIVVDRQVFVRPEHDPAAFDGEGWRPYNAGPDPLLIAHQSSTLQLRLTPQGRWTGQLSPPLAGVRVDTSGLRPDTTAATCGGWRQSLQLSAQAEASAGQSVSPALEPAPWVLSVTGPLPSACTSVDWPVLWTGAGPGDHAERVIRALWSELGGTWQGRLVDGRWPGGLTGWRTWSSPPLAQVVSDINKFSNNVMARQLMLSLPGVPGTTLDQARLALTQTIGDALPACVQDTLTLDNGSGLSRTEGSSARCMGLWLQRMWLSPVMPELVASLPVTGVDGTTRRWAGAARLAHIKTGSLNGVTGVAGYVLGQSGQRHIVVAVVNHPQAAQAKPWLNAVLDWTRQDMPEGPVPQN